VGEEGSVRIEIDIAALLLGFLFLIISIVMTAPTDVLQIMNNTVVRTSTNLFIRSSSMVAVSTLGTLLLLFGSLMLYLIYYNKSKKWILGLARSSLVLSIYYVFDLSLLFASVFAVRLVGTEADAIINPLYGYSKTISFVVAAIFIAIIWLPYFNRAFEHMSTLFQRIKVRIRKSKLS
jgi:hypothetical protein